MGDALGSKDEKFSHLPVPHLTFSTPRDTIMESLVLCEILQGA